MSSTARSIPLLSTGLSCGTRFMRACRQQGVLTCRLDWAETATTGAPSMLAQSVCSRSGRASCLGAAAPPQLCWWEPDAWNLTLTLTPPVDRKQCWLPASDLTAGTCRRRRMPQQRPKIGAFWCQPVASSWQGLTGWRHGDRSAAAHCATHTCGCLRAYGATQQKCVTVCTALPTTAAPAKPTAPSDTSI